MSVIPSHTQAVVSHSLWIRVPSDEVARCHSQSHLAYDMSIYVSQATRCPPRWPLWDRTRVSLGVEPLADPTARVPRRRGSNYSVAAVAA